MFTPTTIDRNKYATPYEVLHNGTQEEQIEMAAALRSMVFKKKVEGDDSWPTYEDWAVRLERAAAETEVVAA
jgi:hypothetical protein